MPIATVVLAALALSSCAGAQRTPPVQLWPDMKLQKRFEAQATTTLFDDHRASRRRPDGVVARGHLQEENPMNTGMENGLFVGKMPVPVTEAMITEGQWRFNTYCAPCHDQTGLGRGMVPQRWTAWQPQNLMEDRIVEMADGDLFDVITYGRRTMPPYGAQNRVAERWAIIAYLRVLQRASHATIADVPEQLRTSVEYKGVPASAVPATPTKDGGAKQ